MAAKPFLTASASSGWASSLPLPFWLTSGVRRDSKVRLHGTVDAVYLEHHRLVLQAGEENDLVWVFYDDHTHFDGIEPQVLSPGQKLQVDGVLHDNQVQATRVKLLG